MAQKQNRENLLSSWKEIAAYLGCDARTCLRWENNFDLPVHRMEGASKSRVFAYKDELDGWRQARTKNGKSANNSDSARETHNAPLEIANAKASQGFHWRKSYYFLFPILAALILYVLVTNLPGRSEPTDFKTENSQLIILDKQGKELWRYPTGLENLEEEKVYREHFQFKRPRPGNPGWPYLMIKDINHDGHPEVLFSPKTQDETKEGDLFCFNDRGKKLWQFKGGRELKFGSKLYSADYRPRGFEVDDLNNDGKMEVVAVFLHRPNWPTQLAVLDSRGKLMGEYWNSGHLADLAFVDLNGDGRKEVIASGNNNEYHKGCLLVFDPSEVRGTSPNTGEFKCQELGRGSEKYYILFPRTDVDLEEYPFESIQKIDLLENHQLSLTTAISYLIFELDYELKLRDIVISHTFMQKHQQALAEGKIKSKIGDKYKNDLMNGILYWDGDRWTNKPTMNLRWKESKPAVTDR